MRRLCICFVFWIATACAADDPSEILNQVAHKVAEELAKAANYTCVQTIDRTYFADTNPQANGCAAQIGEREQIMHDRLRLDIAVSEGREIYGWHAQSKFSSATVADVVEKGPISSGNFIGFLQNVFLHAGTHFTYDGKSERNGVPVFRFKYAVPIEVSGYHVQSAAHAAPIVAFHGRFDVNAVDFQLMTLQVIADSPSKQTGLCSIETDVTYQMADISGKPSMIPQNFELKVTTSSGVSSLSRSDYSQCREYRGESTLRFDLGAATAPDPLDAPIRPQWLTGNLELKIGLRTPIDDRTSYTGDAVQGTLLSSVSVPGTDLILPRGALLSGLILQLEHHFQPWQYSLISIQFDRVTFGRKTFLLKALPVTTKKSMQTLADVYELPLHDAIAAEADRGVFALMTAHAHLDTRFSGVWKTVKPSEKTTAGSQ